MAGGSGKARFAKDYGKSVPPRERCMRKIFDTKGTAGDEMDKILTHARFIFRWVQSIRQKKTAVNFLG